MNTAIALLIVILSAWFLAYRRAPLLLWAASAVIGFIAMLLLGSISTVLVVATGLVAALLVAFNVEPVRRMLLSGPIYKLFVRLLPPMSDTEREALEAGTVWWDAELFAGRPEWDRLLDAPAPRLKEHEQAFIDGPLRELCEHIDDWNINHERRELPPQIWQMLKDKGFFGMIIDEAHGGLGFSAQAQSDVVSMLSTRSLAVAVTVMVPNSLGPGELLHRFGTEAQKDHYLPRLARGEEIPAFGLTGPYAGSDAASMRDTGIVCRDIYKGEEVLGLRLNWEKRYITLGPVATVLGLAFKLYDPDHLLGEEEDRGITLALIPTDWPRRGNRPPALSRRSGVSERPQQRHRCVCSTRLHYRWRRRYRDAAGRC